MPEAVVNEVCIHYDLNGKGHPVVLLHPVGLDLSCWESQVETLCTEFQVLAIDLRGHGRSEVTPPPYSLGIFAADVHALLLFLGLAPAHVVGLSLGGMVAQVLALEYPEDVMSLVLSDTASSLSSEGRAAMIARGRAAAQGGMESVVPATLERWFTTGFMGSEVVARCRRRLLADNVVAWEATWQAISELNTEPRLGEIEVPTLVVHGELDASSPVERANRMAEAIRRGQFHLMPGAPHMAPLERPVLFNPPVLEFLRAAQDRSASSRKSER